MVDRNENGALTVAESQTVSQEIAIAAAEAPTEIKAQAQALAASTELDARWVAAYNGMIAACNAAGFTHP